MTEDGIVYTVTQGDNPYPLAHAATPIGITRKANRIMAETGEGVWVSWRRASDGCVGGLDQDGGHTPTGQLWDPPEVKPIHKKIGMSGTSLTINVTTEVKNLGLGYGDEVKITLERP